MPRITTSFKGKFISDEAAAGSSKLELLNSGVFASSQQNTSLDELLWEKGTGKGFWVQDKTIFQINEDPVPKAARPK